MLDYTCLRIMRLESYVVHIKFIFATEEHRHTRRTQFRDNLVASISNNNLSCKCFIPKTLVLYSLTQYSTNFR